MPIRVLDPKTVSQIAAGEVVERPASVVKELVENSLDAGSTQVSVEVRGGGVSLIRVMDNGAGIPAEEVGLALARHATSKIGGLDDLEHIESLGFRGEALPSIAAVAEVEIATCAAGQSAGTCLRAEDGAVVDKRSQGRSKGTTVTVRHLFRKVPARLKFLKSQATENGHITDVVSRYALAFPEVRFALLVDGKAVLRTPGSGRLIDGIVEVYGLDAARNMLEIDSRNREWEGGAEGLPVQVSGMVGSSAVSRSNRGYLNFFVNRRWVSSRMLAWAVEEAYHGLLMTGKHPVAVVNISLSPGQLDVNIHPAKTEVKFQNERAVFASVQKVIRQALVQSAPVPRIEEVAGRDIPTFRTPELWESVVGGQRHVASALPSSPPPMVSLPLLRVLGQLAGSYIVAEGPDGLYLIDQHAAHERILFEKVEQQRAARKMEVQGLLEPMTLEVDLKQDAVMKSRYHDMAEFGFDIEPFGERTYLVRAVPVLLYDRDWAEMIKEILDSPSGGSWGERIAVSIACHGAVRAGQSLTGDEMRELIRELEQAANPHTCPHGRPTMIHLSSKQLEKEFGRS